MKPTIEPFDLSETPITDGTTLIEASAGTGKTYSLTGLLLRLLVEERVPSASAILVMTFTKAATAELVTRIRGVVRDAIATFRGEVAQPDTFLQTLAERHGTAGLGVLQRALRDLDDLEVSTIHGFCRRMLAQNAFETSVPFDIEYGEDDGTLLAGAAEDLWRRVVYPAGDLVGAVVDAKTWQPTSFLEHYRTIRRHDDIEILPSTVPLADAVAGLESAASRMRDAWSLEQMSAFLATAQYEAGPGKRPSPAEQRARLAAADAFCRRGDTGALRHVLTFGQRGRKTNLLAASKRALAELSFPVAVDAMSEAIATFEHSLRVTFFDGLDTLVSDAKRHAAVAYYDDLLHRMRDALRDPARAPALERAARSQFRAVLVDEFQDTDTVQYEILRRFFGDGLLFFVGDPKQAIYGFRGADVFAYLEAKRGAGRELTLGRNYRSETPLVEAVNAVFENAVEPFVFAEIPFRRATAAGCADDERIAGDGRRALEWIRLPDETSKERAGQNATAAVVAEIVRLLSVDSAVRIGDRSVLPRDIAVLVDTNRAASEVQSRLRRAHVPAVVSQSGNVFESDEAVELEALLGAVISPRSASAVRGALATRTFGRDARDIAALGETGQTGHDWDRLIATLQELRDVWTQRGFVAMAESLLALTSARQRLLAGDGGARRLTNLLHLIELVEQEGKQRHLSPDGALAWLARMRAQPKLHAGDAAEIRLESDAEAVQITTIHKSKGLEYPITFCPFLWRVFGGGDDSPLLAHLPGGRIVFHYPEVDDTVRVAHERESISERVRNAYVALTRAKHRCYVVWCSVSRSAEKRQTTSQGSALAHLLSPACDAGVGPAIDALCAARPDLMAVRDVGADVDVGRWQSRVEVRGELRARDFPLEAQKQLVPWRVASFSSFRSTAETGAERPDYRDPESEPVRAEAPPAGIFAFASGVRAGTCLHEIFERCDFTRVDDAEAAELVATTLQRHGLADRAAHDGRIDPVGTVRALLADVVGSPLPKAGFTLSAVEMRSRLPEWQFHLPMAAVSPQRLADVFGAYSTDPVPAGYADRLRRLGSRDVEGFLMGFVDLVFVHEGRWYLVDWKSNHLGNDVADYGDDSIGRAMRDHHYVLQYHLYTLALHRYLAQRLRDYDYDTHFGGAYYAFLRGIRAGTDSGWYFDRAPRARIDALDRLMLGEPTS
jgi:exodeoxyribonuclease V beta subunit